MNSINRIEAGSTSTPAVAPRAQGVNKLALATALFAGIASGACGETKETECQEPANKDYLAFGTAKSEDGFNYRISFKRKGTPVCFEETAEDPFYVLADVNSSGTKTEKQDDPLAEYDPQNPGVPYSQSFFSQAERLEANVGAYDTLRFGTDKSPDLEDGDKVSQVVQGVRICLLATNPGKVTDKDYSKKVEENLIYCTKEKSM